MGVFSRQQFGASESLKEISSWLESPNASEDSRIWNYGRYAYITLETTGENNAGLCGAPVGITLGDVVESGGYSSIVRRDGGRDIPARPILDSVRISNDGSTDMSDAALFDIDVSFKCFSLEQFEIYENAFFKVGTEIRLKFGYKELGLEKADLLANVYNFGFTLDQTGVYSCNMKLTGKNRFAAILSLTQELTSKGTEVTDSEGNTKTANSIIGEINARFESAFPDFEESSFIQRSSTADFVEDGKAKLSDNGGFAVANIQTKGGFDASFLGLNVDTDDMFVKYITFKEFIDVINMAHSTAGFKWDFIETESGVVKSEFASADPSILLLGGAMGNYGGNDDTSNNLGEGIPFNGKPSEMLLSIEYITKELNNLIQKEKEDKQSKGDTSVNNFLRILCETIKDLTGGLYQLTIFNDGYGINYDPDTFYVVNERAEHEKGINAGYVFTLHKKGSVLKSVNMSSNMDSDMAAAALVSNRGGEVPEGAFDNLYSECGGVVKQEQSDPVTLADIAEKKEQLGLGFSPERVQELKDVMKSYRTKNPKETKTDTGYRYMIDLSVGTFGVWGTQIGDTFTFDGLPSKYKGNGKYFCVGKMQHSFDGRGGWDVEYTGFLKLDTV